MDMKQLTELERMQQLAGLPVDEVNIVNPKSNYRKVEELIKSHEDDDMLEYFYEEFPKDLDIDYDDYYEFVRDFADDSDDVSYIRPNWDYYVNDDLDAFDKAQEGYYDDKF